MAEVGVDFQLVDSNPWLEPDRLPKVPEDASETPVVVTESGLVMSESHAICEYLGEVTCGEASPAANLIGQDPKTRFEVRRLSMFIEKEFYYSSIRPLLQEKIIKCFLGYPPDSSRLRDALRNLKQHLDRIEGILAKQSWIATNELSLADLTAAAQISVLDYLHHIEWQEFKALKDWYLVIKSRPSFCSILADSLQGFTPPRHYRLYDY